MQKFFTNNINFSYAITTALLFSFSAAPFNQWFLAYFAFIPIIYRTYSANLKNVASLYVTTALIISVTWAHSILTYSWLNFLVVIAVVCLSFLIWGLLNLYVYQHVHKKPWYFLAPAFIWVGIERLQTSTYIGIPGNIGVTQSSQPELIQLTSIFGIYAVSFSIILINCLLAHSLYIHKNTNKSLLSSLSGVFLAISIFSLNYLFGSYSINHNDEQTNIKIAIVQPAISSETYRNSKRNLDDRKHIKNILHTLSTEALSHDIDILFWPEGGDGHINMRLNDNRNDFFNMAKNSRTNLLISADDINSNGEKFNSVFSISSAGKYTSRYDKIHLIPGAEDSYTPGKTYNTLTTTDGEIGVAICFESTFSKIFRKSTDSGAEILFASTSDAAFKQTSLALNHANLSVFRALENNRWLVHASNAGPSIVVSPKGVITNKTTMYDRDILYANIKKIQKKSIYTRWGYLIPLNLSAIVILLSIILLVKKLLRVTKTISHKQTNLFINTTSDIFTSKIRNSFYYIAVCAAISVSLVVSSIYIVNIPISKTGSIGNILSNLLQPINKHKDTLSLRFLQQHNNTCGPAALSYLFNHYGLNVDEKDISKHINISRDGTSMLELKRATSIFGFQGKGYESNFAWLKQQNLPLIAYINDNHYVVINKFSKDNIFMFDPSKGHVIVKHDSFEKVWRGYSLIIRTKPITDTIIRTTTLSTDNP